MARTAQNEMQLAAFAAGVDRANRPTSLLTIPALILAVAVIYAGWSFRAMLSSRAALKNTQVQVDEIRDLATSIHAEKTKGVDLGALYDARPFFGSQVGEETWKTGSLGFRQVPIISGPTPSTVFTTPRLDRQDVTCTVNDEPLPAIFEAIERTLDHQFLKGRAFVSQVMLTPAGSGWRGTIRFSLYESKEVR